MAVADEGVTLFLAGDVMLGRGVDQILPHPGDPQLYEGYVTSAVEYVEIAEARNGPIPRPVDFAYVWGDALAEIARAGARARIVNLETAVTASDEAWPGKGINYRMHPRNTPALTAACIDCCVLANNHVLDWGRAGLEETLDTLHAAGIRTAGAGRDADEAARPAVLEVGGGARVAVLGFGLTSSGIPFEWRAAPGSPGVALLPDLGHASVRAVAARVAEVRRGNTLVVVSLHWGGNWGYEVSAAERAFARALVEEAAVDVVHGHSSHHPKAIELHAGRAIFYGCGDLVNDYEGIGGWEEFRPDVRALYFVTLDPRSGRVVRLGVTPMHMSRMRLGRAGDEDARWLLALLDREGRRCGTRAERAPDGTIAVVSA
jgi:poly-gamma-glutamate capsule biosynthesis protein CapA/YwtB (metallophosphatase superfamily)